MIRLSRFLPPVALFAAVALVVALPPATPTSAADGYQPLDTPQRLLDTRPGSVTADQAFAGGGAVGGGEFLALDVADRAGIPDDPGSVVLNVTATDSTRPGFIAVWPCEQPQPPTANLNYAAGQTIANMVIAKVDSAGTVCLFARSTVHLVVDAAGYLPSDSFDPLPAPERLADTRGGNDTVDGESAGDGRRAAASTYRVKIAGRGSIPGDARAVVLNVAVTDPLDRGFLTIHSCQTERPLAANLTYARGQTIPNAVLTRLDDNGEICIFTRSATHLVVDATGVLPGSVFTPLDAPRRIVDTRPGETTFDGHYQGVGSQPAFATMQLEVAGRADIPADAAGVVLNVTSTGSSQRGFVTAHPQGTARPNAANLNFPPGATVSNLVVAAVGGEGDVCLYTRGATHLVVDVVGWVSGPSVDSGSAACPGRGSTSSTEQLRTTHVLRAPLQRAVGTDRIAVVLCRVPTGSPHFPNGRHDRSATDIAAFLNREVSPYYAEISNGRYAVEFTAIGSIDLNSSQRADDCLRGAAAAAGAPYTGSFGVDNTLSGGGFAGPGRIWREPGRDRTVFDGSPNSTLRGGWVGGSSVSQRPNPGTFIHELGHMLHWPHSFIGPSFEYDNWVDVMSRGRGLCEQPGGATTLYACDPAHTIAFNRLAAGWLGDGDVIVHRGGAVNYLLDRPAAAGAQMLMLPDHAQPLNMMTIEARPAVGNDDFLEREGVALHVVDQLDRGVGWVPGVSVDRRQRQATGSPSTYEHVVPLGGELSVHGVTVKVIERRGDQFLIQVSGRYRMPGADFFTSAFTHHATDIVRQPVSPPTDPWR